MRFNYFVAPLVLLPFCAFSQPENIVGTMLFSQNPVAKNTIVKTYSNESEGLNLLKIATRSVDYPTQIIRTTGSTDGQQLSCDQVNEIIQNKVVAPITADKFFYNTYIGCTYDPDTHFAKTFFINSYFDPLSDEAIDLLNTYLTENNNSDLLGTTLKIESAKSLVISMSIAAGVRKNPDSPPFIEYRQDRSNFYFSSNYEMKNKLFADIYGNFFSNDPEKILPFLDKWVFSYASKVYYSILRDANYVELQPERIFVMDSGEPIFVSGLRFYFGHNCNKYNNHRCLKQGA